MPLFEIANFYSEIYKWSNILVEKSIHIIGYVIMPNHVHCLLYMPEGCEPLNKIIGNGKRFMAYQLVRQLTFMSKLNVLKQLEEGVSKRERKVGKKHQVFQASFDAKPCYSDWFIEQKLDYIHHNPVSGKWELVEDYTD